MADRLKAGVAGAGVFGGHHARKYAGMGGIELVGVYDPFADPGLAESLGVQAFTELAPFLEAVDVVTVASPADTHAATALAALKAGRHVYVEKPIAVTLEEADALVAEAARRKLVLAVGHQERVVFRAMGLLDAPERPLRLEAVRKGPWSPRNADVSAILDLTIHDIDLALALNPADVLTVEAEGIVDKGPLIDAVRAEATFEDGMVAVFETSRVAEARERRMKVVFPSGEVELDFLTRAFSNTTPFALNADFTETPDGKDPLGASVAGFIAAVRGEASRPVVTGAEAARALDLALAVEQAAGG